MPPSGMSAVIPAHGSLPPLASSGSPVTGRCSQQTSPPAIDSQRNQGYRAVQSAHPPCHQVAMYLPSAAHISTSSSRQHAVKRVEQGRFNGCTTVINRRISANLRECCRQKVASLLGKIPGARQEMLGVGKMGLTSVQTMPDSPHRQQNCLLLPTKFLKTKKASYKPPQKIQREHIQNIDFIEKKHHKILVDAQHSSLS